MNFDLLFASSAFHQLDIDLQERLRRWTDFYNRNLVDQTEVWPSDAELRKAWLKKLFGSFQYHEDLVRLHWPWVQYIKQAIERPYVREKFPLAYDFFKRIAIPNFEKVVRPGQLDPAKWVNGASGGAARSIGYYDHDTGLDGSQLGVVYRGRPLFYLSSQRSNEADVDEYSKDGRPNLG